MSNALGSIGKWRCPEIDGSLNSRLYVVSLPILVHLRKPWRGHSRYSANGTASVAIDGLREVREAWWWLLSTKVDGWAWSTRGCASSISGMAVDSATRGPGYPTWSSRVCPRQVVGVAAGAARRFVGRGSSSPVSRELWLSSVFTEWWVSLLISVCMSWCPRFRVAGLPVATGQRPTPRNAPTKKITTMLKLL